MALKPRAVDLQRREQRQRNYVSSTTVATQFPQVTEVALDLRFTTGPDKPLLSPYSQIYTADMQAFFELQCPSRDCAGGGFDLRTAVARAVQSPAKAGNGKLPCTGIATNAEVKKTKCPVEMTYEVAVTVKAR